MKRLLIIGTLVAWAAAPAAAEPTLRGQWISDRDASASFNEEHVRMQAKTAAFLKDSMGRLVVTFSSNDVSYDLPNFTTKIEGKEHPIVGFSETHPYTVIATTPNSIAIRTTEPVSHEPTIVVYNFVGNDRMWVYVSTLGSHIREYFKRVEAK
jgi:hypothetical protein